MSNVPITHAALLTYPGNLCLYPPLPNPQSRQLRGQPDKHEERRKARLPQPWASSRDCRNQRARVAQADPWTNAAGRMGAPTKKTPEPKSSSLGCPLALQQGLGETHSQLGIRGQLHQLVLGKTTNTNRPLCSHNFPTSSP